MLHQHIDVLREAARRLGRDSLAERLGQWSPQSRQGDLRVAFVGRGSHKTQLIHRLLGRDADAAGPVPVPVRFVHGAADSIVVHRADSPPADPRPGDLRAAVSVSDVTAATVVCDAMPPGVQWFDTVAANAFNVSADRDTRDMLRLCDAMVLVVSAADAFHAADATVLRQAAVLDAHIPAIDVVVTDTAELAPPDLTRVLSYVENLVRAVSGEVTVSAEPAPGSAAYSSWRQELLARQRPDDLDDVRRVQAEAQLRDIGEQLAAAADERAVEAYRRVGTDDNRLAAVQTRAEWVLDAASVRRELQVRRQRAVEGATRDVERVAAELVDRTQRLLKVSSGTANDAVEIFADLKGRADSALARARTRFARAVATDIAWLDLRLRTYFEAWSPDAGLDRFLPRHGPSMERCMPRMQPAWVARVVATPLDVFVEVGIETVYLLLSDRGDDRSDAELVRRFAVKALASRRAKTAASVGDAAQRFVMSWAERHDSRRPGDGGQVAVAALDVSLLQDGGALAAVTAQLYDALADEFDAQRREWRRTQLDNADRVRGAAGVEWQGLADRIRGLLGARP